VQVDTGVTGAVGCAMANQKPPNGYYRLDRMIETCARHGADIACCGTCINARGVTDEMLNTAARRSMLDELAEWTLWVDQVMTFDTRTLSPRPRCRLPGSTDVFPHERG
jgi:sulfur relay (sulfurtransferase) complex TusBCD TusD component (DsrE family)